MYSKLFVQGLALSVLASVGAAQDCPQNGAASSLFQSCGQVQGSMNVCTTGAVTSCSCSVLAHQSACYQSYKENYCSNWVYQNDYFSANCGDNYVDESSSTKSDKPASATADATTTAEDSSSTSASSSSSASSRSSAASASASATAAASSSASSASASRSGSSSSLSASSASTSGSAASSGTAASASGSGSAATPSASAASSNNAAGSFGIDSLLMAGGLLAALF